MWESDKLTALSAMKRIIISAICIALYAAVGSAQTVESGKRLYQGLCVGCHGEDGSGGGHGPSFLDVRRPRATSREAVRNLILKGIPDGGMPPSNAR
jgi:mono/diheme cytochrome c family protein